MFLGSREIVWFSEIDMLDYVLSHLGLGKAEYTNELVDGSLYLGEVKFWLPEVEDARCGRYTRFHGVQRSWARTTEESAAARVLRFMEKELKMCFVDLHYAERIEAMDRYNAKLALLDKSRQLAEKVKKAWSLMLDCLKCGLDVDCGNANEDGGEPFSSGQTCNTPA